MSDTREARLEAITAELQAELRRQHLARNGPYLSEQPDIMARVRQTRWVNPHLPIGWPVMPKGFFAKLSAYAKKITRRLLRWYINPLVEQQNAFNAAVSEVLAYLDNVTSVNKALQTQGGNELELGKVASLAEQQRAVLSEMDHAEAKKLEERLLEHDWEVIREHQRVDHAAEQQRVNELFGKSSEYTQQALEPLRLRIQRLENRYKSQYRAPAQVASEPASTQGSAADTFIIGVQFRNEAQIAQRLSDYDDILAPLAALTDQEHARRVIDIGCGRGELVAHLKALGLDAYGVDIDADAISLGKQKNPGLELLCEDIFAHLQALADGSLQAAIAVQVIEHFSLSEVTRLFRLIYQKLAPNGIIIAETINPVCLWALSNHFLLDPTHHTPLHPQMSQFLLEQAGFAQIKIRYLHPVPDDERLGWIKLDADDTLLAQIDNTMRANIDRLNNFLYGPQDYAASAIKLEN